MSIEGGSGGASAPPGWVPRASLVCPIDGCGWAMTVSWQASGFAAPFEMRARDREPELKRHLRGHGIIGVITPQVRAHPD